MDNNLENQEKPQTDPEEPVFYKNKNIFDYIFEKIIKYKNTALYKFIYNHPKVSVSILILWGIIIMFVFGYFIYTLYKLSSASA